MGDRVEGKKMSVMYKFFPGWTLTDTANPNYFYRWTQPAAADGRTEARPAAANCESHTWMAFNHQNGRQFVKGTQAAAQRPRGGLKQFSKCLPRRSFHAVVETGAVPQFTGKYSGGGVGLQIALNPKTEQLEVVADRRFPSGESS